MKGFTLNVELKDRQCIEEREDMEERDRERARACLAGLKQALVTVQLNKQMFSLFFYRGSTWIPKLSQDICSWRPRLNLRPIGRLTSPPRSASAERRLVARARAQKNEAEPWEFSERFSPLSWPAPTSASNQSWWWWNDCLSLFPPLCFVDSKGRKRERELNHRLN